jgi:hypothetical protein
MKLASRKFVLPAGLCRLIGREKGTPFPFRFQCVKRPSFSSNPAMKLASRKFVQAWVALISSLFPDPAVCCCCEFHSQVAGDAADDGVGAPI